MSGECRFHAATREQLDRLERALVASKLFVDAEELHAVHRQTPWRLQVDDRGHVGVLDRWRDHLAYLSIDALWCPPRAVPGALACFREVGLGLGLTDVVSPPVPLEEVRAYTSGGMRERTIVATYVLAPVVPVVGELPARLVLRHAGHRDIPALLAVDAECFEPFWRYDARHLARFCETGRLVLAERLGKPVGYTLCTVEAGDGLLGRLCVTPEMRLQGIGSALLADAVAHVREHGGERLTLSTQIDNAASQALYRKAGFRDTGRRYAFLRFGTDEG